ncbi:hypothetical protein QO034_06610 [Sedimentitalea sp. JM2-8]|uniref:Fibronectin type-III domain-containing protein n=1 Tax=Sedimentitalea xiamensis TaxID=3050037 RepID=A0ABT7FCD3_9RHOB|nr:hypothetical protein [Sedimentitalea xiamensis]MDK3072776.1 hypothetical protein [Sedimentitalea xiamensis]
MMRILSWAVVCLLFLSLPAEAGPVGAAIVAGIKALTWTKVALAALRAVVGIGLSLLAQRRAKRKQRPAGLQTSFTTKGGTDPQGTVIGWYATGGHEIYRNSHGYNRKFLTQVIELGDLPGVSLRRVIIDGVVSDLVDDAEAGFKGVVSKGTDNGTNFYTIMRFYDGTQTAASDWMIDKYGSGPDRSWTPDHILTGVSYVVVNHHSSRERYPNGVPEMRFEMDGIPFYDPRQDDTVGGTGAQRWNDRTTWSPTTNAIVLAYNIKRGITTPTGEVWGGGAEAADLPLANWVAAMNACDLPIGDNDRPQFQAGFEIRFEDEPAEVIEELLAACNAEITEVGGVWTVQVGGPAASVVHITDADMLVSEPEEMDPFPGLEATHNAITISHPSPKGLWNGTAIETITNAAWEAADGVRRLFELRLPAVPWAEQARQVGNNMLRDDRPAITHKIVLPGEYFWLTPLMTLTWTSEWNGYDAKLFQITDVAYDLRTMNVALSLRERDPGDFTPDLGLELPDAPRETSVIEVVDAGVPGFDVHPHEVRDGDAAPRQPGIRIVWDSDIADTTRVLAFEVRVKTQTDLAFSGTYGDVRAGAFVLAPLLRDTLYEVRARAISPSRESFWTGWEEVTTPDVGLSPADLSDDIWDAIAVDLIAPEVGRIDRELDLKTIDQITVTETVGMINERVLWLLTRSSATDRMIRDAGVYVDPDDGKVRIAAVESQADKISETEIRLNAAEASINLRATQSWVNGQISAAVLDPSQVPILDDLELRIMNAEIDIDGAEAAILLKADAAVVDGIDTRLSQAEIDIDAAETAIALKVSQTDFNAVETRVATAEVTIAAMDGAAITSTVADTRYLFDAASARSAADLKALLQAYEDRKALRQDLAYASEDIRALVSDERTATAAITEALGAAIAGNQALIETEKSLRVTEDAALAADLTALESRVTTTEGGIAGQATAIDGLETRVEDTEDAISAQAQAIVDLEARVEDSEDEVAGLATATTNLTARVDDTEDDISAQATAITNLQTTVGGHTTSIGQALSSIDGIRAEYTLRIDNNGVVSGMVLRSELDNLGEPASAAAFQVDKFAIVGPGGAQVSPFVVYTTPRVIDGVTYPAGVYARDAVIGTARIGRAQIKDVVQSDNYAEDAGGVPTAGMKLNFATGVVKTAGVVMSRPLVLARGSFTHTGTLTSSALFRFVNTGIRVGVNDVWQASNRSLVATAAITTAATASGGLDPSNTFWGLIANIVPGARWFGFTGNPQPSVVWQKDPAVLVDPVWASGSDQRIYLQIQPTIQGSVYFTNATVEWVVYEVT